MVLILFRIPAFREILKPHQLNLKSVFLFSIFFGAVGIYGTYSGVVVDDAVANSRVIGPFVGGIIGGPLIGWFSGLIAGIHRYLVNPDGFSSLACVIITPIQGLCIGLLRAWFLKRTHRWLIAFLLGIAAETIHMGAVILLSRPLEQAIDLVRIIGWPMIIANSVGIGVFVFILESVFRDREQFVSRHAQRVLAIAKETLVHLRKGLTPETTKIAAEIILKRSHLDAVSFTDRSVVLTHIGLGAEFHPVGESIKSEITKQVIQHEEYRVGDHSHTEDSNCPLHSAVVVPIKINHELIGTLKMYKKEVDGISALDVRLAVGLASLFGQQLELAQIEEQQKLLQEAEYHALQAQINPHFLFNALNTISSVIRTSPTQGRELLLNLSSYLRGNLNYSADIPLEKELEHIKAYVSIEKARFGEKLHVDFQVDAPLSLTLPPLTLQPLVENAIKHGVRGKKDGGTVTVLITSDSDGHRISVIDDGVGIEASRVESLLIKSEKSSSVGLINIHERLMHRYGKELGLKIDSEINKGTIISFCIPL